MYVGPVLHATCILTAFLLRYMYMYILKCMYMYMYMRIILCEFRYTLIVWCTCYAWLPSNMFTLPHSRLGDRSPRCQSFSSVSICCSFHANTAGLNSENLSSCFGRLAFRDANLPAYSDAVFCRAFQVF